MELPFFVIINNKRGIGRFTGASMEIAKFKSLAGSFFSFSETFYKLYFNLICIRSRIPNVSIGVSEPSSYEIISTLYYNREVDFQHYINCNYQ